MISCATVTAVIFLTTFIIQVQSSDIRAVVDAPGVGSVNPDASWADSYSVDGVCYCATDYSNIGGFAVPIGNGFATVETVCEAIGPGPGIDTEGAILYNTVQCGNPPKKSVGSSAELHCPGRVDIGTEGCGHIGPMWNLRGLNLPQDKGEPAPADLKEEGITYVLDIDTNRSPRRNWIDSYSIGDRCYCKTTFDHGIRDVPVETPFGWHTIKDICDAIGAGPGVDSEGAIPYNDVQCGHLGNDAGDEDSDIGCPGRIDRGMDGCGQIGPCWNFDGVSLPRNPATPPVVETPAPTAAETLAPTSAPTSAETLAPTSAPTAAETLAPTAEETLAPTAAAETPAPTSAPTAAEETPAPTAAETIAPTPTPSLRGSEQVASDDGGDGNDDDEEEDDASEDVSGDDTADDGSSASDEEESEEILNAVCVKDYDGDEYSLEFVPESELEEMLEDEGVELAGGPTDGGVLLADCTFIKDYSEP